MSYKSILLAISGRGDESKVIDEAVRLTNSLNIRLKVIHVNDPHAGEMSMLMNTPGHKFTEEDIREIFRSHGHEEIADRLDVKIVTGSVVHKEIYKAAKNVNLLILGHRKMNPFKEHFFDSIDEGIVNHVDCPVLVVPRD